MARKFSSTHSRYTAYTSAATVRAARQGSTSRIAALEPRIMKGKTSCIKRPLSTVMRKLGQPIWLGLMLAACLYP